MRLLRGRMGAVVAFLAIAGLVTGGLGRSPGEVARSTLRFHRHWVRANRRRLARGERA